jgi:putative ABC transport system permease protein
MATIIDDLRLSLRLFWRAPGLALLAIVALAIGIGANTSIFSVVNGVLLRPLPYSQPERLAMIYASFPSTKEAWVSYPDFLHWRAENHSFTDIAASGGNWAFNLSGSDGPEHVRGVYVSAGLFRLLGVEPFLGRSFLPEEDRPGAGATAMLSYGLWQRKFGADPNALGKQLTLNGRDYTVIGILPSNFRFLYETDLYLPLAPAASDVRMRGVARLKPGVTLAGAQADMSALASNLAREDPENTGREFTVVPMHDYLVRNIRPTLLLLLGAVGFVLITACANVANLLLARSTSRRREFAVRTALGADRKRILRQLLTESVILGIAAGALGLLLAYSGTRLMLAAVPYDLPHTQQVSIDGYVLLFTLAVSVLTGIVFGLAPAFHGSNVNPQEFLKDGARTSSSGRRRAEGAFVAVQIALAVVLLAGAGLMMQSIWRLWQVDPGFDPSHVLTSEIALSPTVAGSASRVRTAYRETLERVAATPGVQSAAISASPIPLDGSISQANVWVGAGPQPSPDRMSLALFFVTTPGYLRVMGIPLLKGRFFTERDTPASPPVVVIDDIMARHLFPNQDAIGKEINLGTPLGLTRIVGVVGHVKHWGLDSDDKAEVRNEVYFPFDQLPDQYMREETAGLYLLIRTANDPLSVVPSVRQAVAGPANDQPIFDVRIMEQIVSGSLAERRFTMLLLIVFASTALVLAAIGVYGVMAYAVSRRIRELGVRVVLGARRGDVLKLVLREGMVLAAIGLAVGLAGALGLTRLLATMLYGVRPADPATLCVVSLTLLGVAFLASYLPARRATRVDPMVALRHE